MSGHHISDISDMWKAISNLFGGTETAGYVVKKATDGIYNSIDKITYTDEEQAADQIQVTARFLSFVEKTFDENSVRNVTRRWLAWGVVSWTLANAQLAIIFAVLGHDAVVNRIIDVATQFQIGWAFVAVLTAYFGVSFIRSRNTK